MGRWPNSSTTKNLGSNPFRELPLQPVLGPGPAQSYNQRFEGEEEYAVAASIALIPSATANMGFVGAGRTEQG
jgi:hypothetical protein